MTIAIRQVFHSNGNIKEEYQHQDGIRSGYSKEWHENGQLSVDATFKNDMPDGTVQFWHPNGQLKHQAFFKDGCKQGDCIWWDERGIVTYKCFFLPGAKPHGIELTRNKSGKETKKYFWNGVRKRFDPNHAELYIDFLMNLGHEIKPTTDTSTTKQRHLSLQTLLNG